MYIILANNLSTPDEINEAKFNIRAKEALLSALSNSEMTNVMDLQTAYEIQKKLETLYEGDSHVKVAKLQRLKGKYEMLNMGKDENITSFMQKVNEFLLNIKCVGGVLEEFEIVAKVLISLSPTYKHKATAIEEIETVTDVTRDMFIGKLVAFELREFGEAPPKFESAVKSTISKKQKYDPRQSSTWVSRYEKEMREIEEEEREIKELEALIFIRLPKGVDKYEGKLPLKCFSCNKIGYFSSRCPKRVSKKILNPYKSKYQKKCYFVVVEDVIDDESEKGNSGDE